MRRLYALLAIGLLVCVVAGARLGWSRADGRAPRQAQTDAGRTPAPRTLGVMSCASMACHHGNGPRGSKGSEYSTWIAVDPHGRAYQALRKPESQRMHENLSRYDEAYRKY